MLRRTRPAALALATAAALAGTAASAAEVLVVPLMEPEIVATGTGRLVPYSWAEYGERVAPLRGREGFVAIDRRPADLSAAARFGFNVVLGANVGWAYDRDADGPFLLVDTDRDGDLADERRLRFEARRGERVATLEHRVADAETGTAYPVRIDFVLEDPEEPRIVERPTTLRRGTIRLGGREIAVAAEGWSGLYGGPPQPVLFDLDGDGVLAGGGLSPERYLARDERVELAGRSYRFEVDRHGRTLTLTPVAGPAARASIAPGSPAPDFAFTVLGGSIQRLDDHRGKVVLLEFWGSWCGPCRDDLPHLLALHRELAPRGFEIVGIANDRLPELTAYVAEHRIPWPVALEPEGSGPAHHLYRATAYPTYFLIARDGTLVDLPEGWPERRRRILDLLGQTTTAR